MREFCCAIVSAAMIRFLFVFFVFEFGIVGATFGAIAGTLMGWSNNKSKLKESIIIGTASGTVMSYKLVKAIYDYLHSDDDELVFVVRLVKLIAGDLGKILHYDEHKIMGFNKGTNHQWKLMTSEKTST